MHTPVMDPPIASHQYESFRAHFHCLNLRDFCPILRAVREMLSKKE